MKSKNIKVAYTTRYPQSGMTTVPKIQMEGRWLEALGFSIGSTIIVEYGEGSIHIRPLTPDELAAKQQHELESELKRRRIEIAAMEKDLETAYADLPRVAEPAAAYASSTSKTSKKRK